MTTHAQAKAIIDAIVPDPAQSLYLRALSSHETHYGDWWPGTNNWGAMIGKGDAGSEPHKDHDAAGKWYTTDFAKYSSPAVGARALASLVLKSNVTDALAAGDLTAAVAAMIDDNHYTGNPPATPAVSYEKSIRKGIDAIIAETGEKNPFLEPDCPWLSEAGARLLGF
jgi:hypothetical protein